MYHELRKRGTSLSTPFEEMSMKARLSRLTMIVLLSSIPLGAMAQTAPPAPTAPPAQPATAPEQPLLKAEELEQLVAPIALYPDPLLSQV